MNNQRNQRGPRQQQNDITQINQQLRNNRKPISSVFSPQDLYLPRGTAHKIALALDDLNINQLRKIFTMIERAHFLSKEGNFNQAKETLFMVVPMVAYATGRQLIKPKEFNEFFQLVITPDTIKSADDIQALFKLMQSIIAYKKK